MKKILLFQLFFLFSCIISQGQKTSKYKPDIVANDEIDSLDYYNLLRLLDIDILKYYIPVKFKKNYCNIIIEEYDSGVLVDSFNLIKSMDSEDLKITTKFFLSVENYLEKNTFPIKFYSKKENDTLLKLNIRVGGVGANRKLKLKVNKSYSYKEVYNFREKKYDLSINKKFPLLVYTMPVGKEFNKVAKNSNEFCMINGDNIDYKDWYVKLGIEHYFVIFIQLLQ